ncbi:MAG: nitroreductase [Bacteriovoracaceae bacterium]|jgi:nitroreductase
MKDFYSVLNEHRSIRKYKNTPVKKELIQKILEAGSRASSSGNMQPYSIIVTTDKDLKKELLPLHFNQSMVMDAPVLLTFCADFNRMRKWLKINQAPENFDNLMSYLIGMIDATLASQNVALAAEAEGLGICFMGTTLASNKEISKVLNLPSHVVPVVGFSLGYPDERPERRDRLPLEGIVHFETYKDYSDKEIEEIYHQKETEGLKRYQSDPKLRAMMKESQVQNLAQVYTKLKYTRESHLVYSKDVFDCLEEAGFLHFQ